MHKKALFSRLNRLFSILLKYTKNNRNVCISDGDNKFLTLGVSF